MLKSLNLSAFLIAATLAACAPPAQPPAEPKAAQPPVAEEATARLGDLRIVDAWAAATPGGASVAAAYLTIANDGAAADRLIGASTPRAGRVEIHEMIMDGALMQMRPVEGVDIPAGGAAELAPGGLHLMLMDIPAPLAAGETVPIELRFQTAGVVLVEAPVRDRAGAGH